MQRYGAVELGGTKTLVAAGTPGEDLSDIRRIETGEDPAATCAEVVAMLEPMGIAAVGIASFGPLQLRPSDPAFGSISSTPKPGWSHFDLVGAIAGPLGVPCGIDTDVGSAALAEGRWGASSGLADHVYITVGTGVGAGIVLGGRVHHGASHPEFGHVPVVADPGDDFAGSCPYHGRCLEGMASGPSIEARFGRSHSDLSDVELAEAAGIVAGYVAQGARTLVYTISPERIVIGGGVSKLPDFHRLVSDRLVVELAGYGISDRHRSDGFITSPGLGDSSGLAGALALAADAVN